MRPHDDDLIDGQLLDLHHHLQQEEDRLTSLCAILQAPASSRLERDLTTVRARRRALEMCLSFLPGQGAASPVRRLAELLLDSLVSRYTETNPNRN